MFFFLQFDDTNRILQLFVLFENIFYRGRQIYQYQAHLLLHLSWNHCYLLQQTDQTVCPLKSGEQRVFLIASGKGR